MSHGASIHVQGKILEQVFFRKTPALPSRCRCRFHDEQCHTRAVPGCAIQQRLQNLFLCSVGLNVRDSLQQRRRPTAVRGLSGSRSRQHFEYSLDEFRLQLRKPLRQNSRDRTFDDLLDFAMFCHAQRTIPRRNLPDAIRESTP